MGSGHDVGAGHAVRGGLVGDEGDRHAVGGGHAGHNPIKARKKAMDHLARREHGREELINKLLRAGFGQDIADEVVARLVDERLQSDARYVEAFITSRINQGKGPLRIRADLRERGISDAAISHGLDAAGHDWFMAAIEVRRKKFGACEPADFEEKARQMRFLQSRGFDTDQVQAAVSASSD